MGVALETVEVFLSESFLRGLFVAGDSLSKSRVACSTGSLGLQEPGPLLQESIILPMSCMASAVSWCIEVQEGVVPLYGLFPSPL